VARRGGLLKVDDVVEKAEEGCGARGGRAVSQLEPWDADADLAETNLASLISHDPIPPLPLAFLVFSAHLDHGGSYD
jgi:hypothetical protein